MIFYFKEIKWNLNTFYKPSAYFNIIEIYNIDKISKEYMNAYQMIKIYIWLYKHVDKKLELGIEIVSARNQNHDKICINYQQIVINYTS